MSIAEMKKITILSKTDDRRHLLDSVRKLGVVHITEKRNISTNELSNAESDKNLLLQCLSVLDAYADKDKKKKAGSEGRASENVLESAKTVVDLFKQKTQAQNDINAIDKYLADMALCDNVSENELKKAFDANSSFALAKADKKQLKSAEFEKIRYIRIPNSPNSLILSLDSLPSGCVTYKMCDKDIVEEKAKKEELENKVRDINKSIASFVSIIPSVKAALKDVNRNIEFERHFGGMVNNGSVAYLEGYIPSDEVSKVKNGLLNEKSFAYLIEDAKGEETPTLIKTNRYTSMLSPVLGILGISPGYEEKDVSFWFLSFFAVFFALIIGDAAYGLIISLIGLALIIKAKKFNAMNKLVLMLGICTFIWGALTGTWFGSEAILTAMPFLQKVVVPQFTNFPSLFGVTDAFTQNSMMRLSFSLGALQLCIACVLNVIQKIKTKDLSFVADIGWFSTILSLYFLALVLVVGQSFNFMIIALGVLVGFVLVLLFRGFEPGISFASGIKKSLAGAFTTFLDTISAFGNVMSYIRLFAVGIASVAISQSFNGLASGLLHGPLIIFGIMILVIGHTLNMVLGLLSVVVHGVRLNVMEFSSQCGIEWAGIEYHPFR